MNDMLGFRDDDNYMPWLASEWGELAPARRDAQAAVLLRDELADVAEKANEPQGATLDVVRLAPTLQLVKYHLDGIDVPSLVELSAWALEREVQPPRRDWLVECPRCRRPWYARPLGSGMELSQRACPRPAPGLTVTCAQLDAADRFARERSEWSKEYRKVMARKVRGTVSEADFRTWKSVSNPGKRGEDWIPFDEWKEQHG